MKIGTKRLSQIVREEVLAHLGGLLGEAPTDVVDAHDDKKDKEDKGTAEPMKAHNEPDNTSGKPKTAGKKEPPVQAEPTDDPADKDLDKEDEPEDLDAVEDDDKKSLSDELEGKTVQSITQEPKSKILPGSQEIVISFNEVADSLHILVTKSGQVKFVWRNAVHNEV